MAFTLKQALEFNKFTVGLATAGLAFAATVGSEIPTQGAPPSACVKWLSTLTIISFGLSVLCGIFVMGRASKLNVSENDRSNDHLMKAWGASHSVLLLIGLLFASVLMFNKVWRFM